MSLQVVAVCSPSNGEF